MRKLIPSVLIFSFPFRKLYFNPKGPQTQEKKAWVAWEIGRCPERTWPSEYEHREATRPSELKNSTPTHSLASKAGVPHMTNRSRTAIWILLILGGAGSLFLLQAHGRSNREQNPVPGTQSVSTGVFPPRKQRPGGEMDPAELFTSKDPTPARPPSRFPELPFVEMSQGLPTSGTWIGYPLLLDFDGDGRADLVASNREEDGYSVWRAPEKGAWTRCIEGPTKESPGLARDMMYGPACGADVNGDGIPDLLVSAHTDALRVYLNDGKMHWTRTTSPIENPFLLLDIALGHVDGDAACDVVGIGHFKGGISVFSGDGKGGFRRLPESQSLLGVKAFGRDIETADFDGNGCDDIVATTNEGLRVFLTKITSPISWENTSAGLPAPKIGNSLTAVCTGKFTGGPHPELAVSMVPDPNDKPEQLDTIGVYAWRADKKTWEQIDTGLDRREAYRDMRAGDINGDGHLDLVTMSIESGGVVYLGDGKGGFEPRGRLPGIHGKGRVALGDIDGDGRLDVAVAIPATKENPLAGGLRVFLNRPIIWQ